MSSIKEKVTKLPDSPGVYFFLGKNRNILYVGRATSLRDRVGSYFSADLGETRGPLIEKMLDEAEDIDFTKTDSVLEAILLEADLIKKFQPKYNTKEKSDKSFNCVVITKEKFPQILIVRQKDIDFPKLTTDDYRLTTVFGPFPNGTLLKEAMKIIRRIFPYRDGKCRPNQGKPCFNRQIGLCPGTCTGEISEKEYKKIIRYIVLFFRGKKKTILDSLEREMKFLAKNGEFEKANEVKKKIFALKHIQDIALIKNQNEVVSRESLVASGFKIEAYDIAHMSGKDMVGVVVSLEDGIPEKSGYRKFIIHGQEEADDTKALKQILERRFAHTEWQFPNLVVVDGGVAQKNVAENFLKQANIDIPVIAVVKDEKHKPRGLFGEEGIINKYKKEILVANGEAHRFAISYHKKKRDRIV